MHAVDERKRAGSVADESFGSLRRGLLPKLPQGGRIGGARRAAFELFPLPLVHPEPQLPSLTGVGLSGKAGLAGIAGLP